MEFSIIYKNLIGIFVLLPFIILLHELGHAFFAKLFGNKNIKITIGSGKPILNLKFIEIRKIYFWFGNYNSSRDKEISKLKKILILSGGALVNLITATTLWILLENKIIEYNFLIPIFISYSFYVGIGTLIPITYYNGTNSDGKQIYQILKYGKSNFYNSRS